MVPDLLFEAFPIAFEQGRGWSPVISTLPFLAVLVGVLISGCFQAGYQPIFWKQLDKAIAAGKRNNPEARLPPMSKSPSPPRSFSVRFRKGLDKKRRDSELTRMI